MFKPKLIINPYYYGTNDIQKFSNKQNWIKHIGIRYSKYENISIYPRELRLHIKIKPLYRIFYFKQINNIINDFLIELDNVIGSEYPEKKIIIFY